MKLLLITILWMCLIVQAWAQHDTVYLNSAFQTLKTNAGAEYYRFYGTPEFGRCKVEDYYLSGKLQSTFYISPVDSTFDGYFTSYYDNGQKEATGNYISGVKTGLWKMRFKDTNAIWFTEEYFPERRDTSKILKNYRKDGRVKRIEYSGDSMHTGVCYTERGDIMPFTSFMTMPRPYYDWQQFVSSKLQYPESAINKGMYGRVNVQFVVLKSGVISNIKALNDAETPLAKEAVRVVSLMPDWVPGMQDNVPVDVYFTLPITFWIDE